METKLVSIYRKVYKIMLVIFRKSRLSYQRFRCDKNLNNGLHHMASNVNHKILYKDKIKKSKGKVLINEQKVREILEKVL